MKATAYCLLSTPLQALGAMALDANLMHFGGIGEGDV